MISCGFGSLSLPALSPAGLLDLLADDVVAELDALVADEYRGAGDQLADLVLALAAERAVEQLAAVVVLAALIVSSSCYLYLTHTLRFRRPNPVYIFGSILAVSGLQSLRFGFSHRCYLKMLIFTVQVVVPILRNGSLKYRLRRTLAPSGADPPLCGAQARPRRPGRIPCFCSALMKLSRSVSAAMVSSGWPVCSAIISFRRSRRIRISGRGCRYPWPGPGSRRWAGES